jgi:hypothetical protein
MKKLLLAMVVSLVASMCLVATPPSAGGADPYAGDVPTRCWVKVDHKTGKSRKVRVLVLVEVPNSEVRPQGRVRVVVRRQGGDVILSRSYDAATHRTVKYFAPRSARSKRYKARVTFTPRSGTVFVGCERVRTFRFDS